MISNIYVPTDKERDAALTLSKAGRPGFQTSIIALRQTYIAMHDEGSPQYVLDDVNSLIREACRQAVAAAKLKAAA